MMHGWKFGLWVAASICWMSAAMAESADEYSPVSGVAKAKPRTDKPSTSTDFLLRQDATPEEDYQAGVIAYNRNELIEAQGIFERAANRGHTGAMVRLAEILNRSGFVAEAAALNLKAANLGNTDAQFSLGEMYLDLHAFDLSQTGVKTDPAEARKWFQLAAEGGHKDAINLMAMMFMNGGPGISDAERTDVEVLKWIHRAIDVNQYPPAMEELARAYREGKYGLGVDQNLAEEWGKKAKIAQGIKDEEVKKKKKKRL